MNSKLLIVLGLFVFFGCRKKELTKTYLVGHAYEAGTDKPLQGVKVKLVSLVSTGNGLFSGAKHTTIDEIITNENGEYHFTFTPANETTKYFLEVEKNFYFSNGNKLPAETVLKTGGNQRLDFYLYAPCYLNIHVKNILPFDNSDEFSTSLYCPDYNVLIGKNIDTTIKIPCAFKAGTNIKYGWWVQKNGIKKHYDAIFKLSPFETYTLEIAY